MTHTATATSFSASGTGASTQHDNEALEQFSYDDDIVRWFVAATILWGIVGTVVGVLVAFLLVCL